MGSGNSMDEAQTGTARPMEAFLDDASSLAPAEFEARHGSAFLLLTATGLSAPESTNSTQVNLDGLEAAGSAHTADLSILVYPVRPARGSVDHLVTLGRAGNNDVVIPDLSVSRFHAFMKRDASGTFLVQDAGSTNGTTVNGASVLARGSGPPSDVKPGDNVRVGQLEFTFVDAAGLRAFVLQSA